MMIESLKEAVEGSKCRNESLCQTNTKGLNCMLTYKPKVQSRGYILSTQAGKENHIEACTIMTTQIIYPTYTSPPLEYSLAVDTTSNFVHVDTRTAVGTMEVGRYRPSKTPLPASPNDSQNLLSHLPAGYSQAY